MQNPNKKPHYRLYTRALSYALMSACHHADPQVVRWCLARGADVVGYNNSGHYSPLHAVCETGSLYPQWEPMNTPAEREEIVKILLDAGADVNSLSAGMGVPPVYCAVRRQYYAITKILIDAGADVNLRDPKAEPDSILWAPLVTGSLDIVQLLLDAGVNIENTNNNGDDAMTVAALALEGEDRDEAIAMIVASRPLHYWAAHKSIMGSQPLSKILREV